MFFLDLVFFHLCHRDLSQKGDIPQIYVTPENYTIEKKKKPTPT